MMKKIVLVFGLLVAFLFIGSPVEAQSSSASVDWSAVNLSQENANAVLNAARPGDLVRYELILSGGDGPGNYNPVVNLSDVLAKAELISSVGGSLEGSNLVYPQKLCAGCEEQRFSFVVRVKEVCESSAESMMASYETSSITVPFDCELTKTGPNLILFLSIGLIAMIMGYFILSLKKEGLN